MHVNDIHSLPNYPAIFERFMLSFELPCEPDDCWPWLGALAGPRMERASFAWRYGKGQRFCTTAARVAWVLFRGPLSDGLNVLHECDNPACVNPWHLFEGTQLDNVMDMRVKLRHAYGQRVPQAKLTPEQVRKIRCDGRAQHVIAADYGVTQSTVSGVKTRKRWQLA